MRYIIGVFVTIGLLFLLIFVLVMGGGKDSNTGKVPSTMKALQTYANTDATVRVTIAGPVVANQEYKETRISVNRNEAMLESINGYDGVVTNAKSYTNTREGYVSFLRSIDRMGFTKGDTSKTLADERGYCALGNRYIFELVENGKTLQRFWSTSCTGTRTYLGNASATLELFEAQIPDFASLIQASGVNL
ncbi:MAG: exported protein of unknown function [Candidatus Saccharibacteria bacterium]|nr:exported protein of unknown function [Candidatus Saccharibacteria bacterium]